MHISEQAASQTQQLRSGRVLGEEEIDLVPVGLEGRSIAPGFGLKKHQACWCWLPRASHRGIVREETLEDSLAVLPLAARALVHDRDDALG